MEPEKKKDSEEIAPQPPLPSTGEGADSALDVLRKKRGQVPPPDEPTLPLKPPARE